MNSEISTKQWIGLIGISLLGFTCFLDITIVANALPSIRTSLAASDTQLQWLVNTIYVGLCACMATMGRMGDVFGLRKVFYTSMVIMGLASLASGLSTTIEALILFRAIQGISLASITMTAALISHNFPLKKQPKAMAIFSAVAGLGLALGPVVGGLLVDFLNWRWIFFINVPIVILGILICSLTVTENRSPEKQSIDWLGAFFFITSITSLVTTIIQGETWGWLSPATVTGFTVAVIALIAFVITEKKVAVPLMPFSLLANSVFISASMTCATCGAFIAVLLFFDPLYLQTILGYSATASGWILFSSSAAYVLMSPIAGFITNHFSAKTGTWLVCALLIIAAAFHLFFGANVNLCFIMLGLISFGMAWGTVNIPPVVAVLHTTSPAHAGVVLGALWTLFNLGSALVLGLVGIVFRFFEYRFLLNNLAESNINIGSQQSDLLWQLVANPEQSGPILKQFPLAAAQHIMPAYKAAFISSFHVVAFVLFCIATISFLTVLLFMKNINLKEKTHHPSVTV